jgi:hypothetical protein
MIRSYKVESLINQMSKDEVRKKKKKTITQKDLKNNGENKK